MILLTWGWGGIATERVKWAMPEMKIGLFCDVGSNYFLSRFPGSCGRFIALTSHTLHLADLFYLNIVHFHSPSSSLPSLLPLILQSRSAGTSPPPFPCDVEALIWKSRGDSRSSATGIGGGERRDGSRKDRELHRRPPRFDRSFFRSRISGGDPPSSPPIHIHILPIPS